jgi:hypothetical protein
MEKTDTQNSFDKIPLLLVFIFLIIVAYFVVLTLGKREGGISINGEGSGSNNIIIGVVCAILFVILVIVVLRHVFNINMIKEAKSLFFETKEVVEEKIQEQPELAKFLPMPQAADVRGKDQVFNVPGNFYGYADAKAVCNAYGSRLAKYGDVENAYKKGGEWCNYGWSDGQMALFPTQQSTYDVLQTKKGHENDCGRPGINGGYMANPNLKFGVNCYGKKPAITPKEADLMRDTTPYPITMEDIEFQNKVDYWKDKVKDILVAPFNYKNWSA